MSAASSRHCTSGVASDHPDAGFHQRHHRRLLIAGIVGLAVAAARPQSFAVAGNGAKELAPDEVNRLAAPAARHFFNEEYLPRLRREQGGSDVPELPPEFFASPTEIRRQPDGWEVLYGGGPSGPTIVVTIDGDGEIAGIDASFAFK